MATTITDAALYARELQHNAEGLLSDAQIAWHGHRHEVENVMARISPSSQPRLAVPRHWQANAAGSDEPITAIIGSDEPASLALS